jgi:pSer/pThr/pTyr-binding forkhead associated (FHA) protein
MKINLKFIFEDVTIERPLEVNESIVCGRSSEADVKIDDPLVSSKHCRFSLKNDRLEIIDLDSKNGIYLNGIRIDQCELFIGDEIKMGGATLRLEEENADVEAQTMLTFPGPFKERISNELKLDFTGARIKNQQTSSRGINQKVRIDDSQLLEIAVRKKIRSKIKLSKEQIRSKNKLMAASATCLDITFLFCLLAVPVILVSYTVPDQMDGVTKQFVFFGIEFMIIGVYYMTNFKLAKFTLGEKVMGIRKFYIEQ